jgi:arylsulfatase A-like enzyme
MSGQYAHTNGLMGLVNRGWSMPEETKTVVDYFNEAGYETAHFGFQHERYVASANRYQVEGLPDYPEDDWASNRDQEWAEVAIPQAIAYLGNREVNDKPFYLNIGTVEVHASRWESNFPDGHIQNRIAIYGEDPPEMVYVPPHLPDVPAIRKSLGRFQGAIRYLDGYFKQLLDAIDRLGLAENTLVVFTTDHGIAGVRAKGTLYEAGTEIALMMRLPGVIEEDMVVPEVIQNIDIAPTLLEAADMPVPESMQGKSFWSRLTGGAYTSHEAIVLERNWHGDYDPMRAVRTPRYHYIRNFAEHPRRAWLPDEMPVTEAALEGDRYHVWPPPVHPRGEEELFDIVNDPNERVDLASDPEYEDIKQKMSSFLDRWMTETDDPLLQGPIPDMLHPSPNQGACNG